MFQFKSSAFASSSALAVAVASALAVSYGRAGVVPGKRRSFTKDAMVTYDALTIDSTGAFLIQELERLDPEMNRPLVAYTWSRDIDVRTDVTIGDEIASWTNSTFAAAGGLNPTGKNWIAKGSNAIPGIQVDIGKTGQPLTLWGMELGWTIPELASAQQVGRPIDSEKLEGLQLKHQMDTDEQVYIGDTTLGFTGLINSAAVTATNVPNGASGHPDWARKTPVEILADVNTLLNAAWVASGYAQVPTDLRIPPTQYAYLNATIISIAGVAGGMSILSFLNLNNLCLAQNGRALNIQPVKWLAGAGASATDRMVAYSKDKKFVRFPMVPLQRTPMEQRSIYHLTTYFGRLGVVEFRYAETAQYADGI